MPGNRALSIGFINPIGNKMIDIKVIKLTTAIPFFCSKRPMNTPENRKKRDQ